MRIPLRRLLPPLLAALLLASLPPARPALALTTLTVTTTADSGPGSLRDAITQANSTTPATERVEIRFNLPGGTNATHPTGGSYKYWTIALGSPLPPITRGNITIDGSQSLAGGVVVPTIELPGRGGFGQGIRLASANNIVRGLIVNGYNAGAALDDGAGVVISGADATGNQVQYCYLGTDPLGAQAGDLLTGSRNAFGVVISSGASNNVVEHSLLSGNARYGASIARTSSTDTSAISGNTIRNNLIGLNAAGNGAIANVQGGVNIGKNANGNVIGPGNVISGNGVAGAVDSRYGVFISGGTDATGLPDGNRVIGNRIGTDATGTAAIPNTGFNSLSAQKGSGGVGIGPSRNTQIGGTGAGDGNLISGNDPNGIFVLDNLSLGISGLVIAGNTIGPDANEAPISVTTQAIGIVLGERARGVTVGPGNVIGGNLLDGVQMTAAAGVTAAQQTANNLIIANRIGARRATSATLPNGRYGVRLKGGTTGNVIGRSAEGNIIVGNESAGIAAESGNAGSPASNTIAANFIGVFPDNTAAPNGLVGVQLQQGANGNTVGPGNTIANHLGVGGAGVLLGNDGVSGTSGNRITGNTLRANQAGVFLTDGANNNTVEANSIRDSAIGGIVVSGSGTNRNRLTQNTTANNGTNGGIKLFPGGNNNVAFTLSGLAVTGGTTLTGSIANFASCGGSCTVEVFDGDTPAAVTNEGPNFRGAGTTTTGAFSIAITNCRPYLTFTVTDNAGNTSQFTGGPFGPVTCAFVGPAATIDPASPSTQTVAAGTSATFSHVIRNSGTASGTFNVTAVSSQGWPTTVAAGGCTFPVTLAPGGSCAFTVRVDVPTGAAPGTSNTTTVTPVVDGSPASGAAVTDTTTVASGPAPQLTAVGPTSKSGKPNTAVTYTFDLKNVGGSPGTFALTLTGLPSGWTYSTTPLANPIGPGITQSGIVLTINIPPGAPAGPPPVAATLVASVSGGPATSSVTVNTTVLLDPKLSFSPATVTPQVGGPGQPLDFIHTLTNQANGTDSFTISTSGPPGWTISVLPAAAINGLAAGASRQVTVRVTPAAGASPTGNPYNITVRACSQTDGTVCAPQVTDQVNVAAAAVPRFDGPQSAAVDPGAASPALAHTVTNVGSLAGTFAITVEAPLGWTAAPPTGTLTNVASGGSANFSYSVTPPSSALAGAYAVRVRAQTTTDANAALALVVDSVTVNKRAGLSLSPASQGPDSQPPATIVTYTLTLNNSGNFTDTITLAASVSRPGWSARVTPASVAWTPGSSGPQTIQVQVTIPPGEPAGAQNVTTVTAQYGAPPSGAAPATATITTSIAAVPGLQLRATPPAVSGLAGETVRATFVLTNSGSVPQTYTLAPGIAAPAAGWSVSLVSPASVTLAPGAAATVLLDITAPAGATTGQQKAITLTATSDVSPNPSATATVTFTVGPVFGVLIAPDNASPARPGAVLTYAHTVTNIGLTSDVFNLSPLSSLGWEVSLSPSSLLLAPGASGTVSVTVVVPPTAPAGAVDTTVVTARSAGDPTVSGSARDATTVLQVAGVSFAPNRAAATSPPREITFRHTVTNSGNGVDSFTFTATQDLDWQVTIVPTRTVSLPRGASQFVTVVVRVPDGTPATAENQVRITAASVFDSATRATLVDTISQRAVRPSGLIFDTFLPIASR